MMENNIDVIILGRNIGTSNGWDKMDECELCFYDFVPNSTHDLLSTPKGCTILNVDFNEGKFIYYKDEDGTLINQLDMVDYFADQKKV